MKEISSGELSIMALLLLFHAENHTDDLGFYVYALGGIVFGGFAWLTTFREEKE
jgi:ATP-dependent protease ClpP protease subunit